MSGKERARLIKEIAGELRLINALAVKQLDDSIRDNLIIARNHLRAITNKVNNADT